MPIKHDGLKGFILDQRSDMNAVRRRSMFGVSMTGSPPTLWTILWTIGHSTRLIEQFIVLLSTHGIRRLVDIHTIAHSPIPDRTPNSMGIHWQKLWPEPASTIDMRPDLGACASP